MNAIGRDIRDVLWVAIPKSLGGLLQVTFNVIFLHVLGPKGFGMLSVCLATVIVCDSFFGSAIDMSIFRLAPLYRERSPLTALELQKVGLVLKPAGALLAAVPLAIFAARVSRMLFQTANETWLLYLTLAALLGTLLIRSTQVHFQIERRYACYGITDVSANLLCFGSIAALLTAGIYSPGKILIAYAVGPIAVSIVVLFWLARAMALAPLSSEAADALLRTLKWFLATVVVGSLLSRMDLFFVSTFSGVREAGIYSAGQIFALLPALLGLYMSAVFSPRIMSLWQEGKLKPIYLRYQAALIGAAVTMYVGALILLRYLTPSILPEAFRRSGEVIVALLPAGLCSFFSFPWTIPLLLYLRPRLLLGIDCVGVLILAPLYAETARHGGAVGVAKLTSAALLIRAVLHQWLALRIVDRRRDATNGTEEFIDRRLDLVRTA